LTALLSVAGVSLVRGDRCLFRDVTFALNSGEALHVEGANGTGKTSLLRLLAGLVAADDGEVCWRGTPVHRVAQEFRNDLLWLGHKVGCKQDLTPVENLQFEQALRPTSTVPFGDILTRLGLDTLTALPLRALSAGQQRRVALARLLMGRARLWLLDEPFTNLDSAGQALVAQLIDEHLASGGLCVAASHQALSIASPYQRLAL